MTVPKGPEIEPLFSIGLLADIQYADDDTDPDVGRYFRESLPKLSEAIAEFNRHDLAAVVHLGDLVDHDLSNTPPVLDRLAASTAPVQHVLGNHDFTSRATPTGKHDPAEVAKAFGLTEPYSSFDLPGWRLIMLNTNEVGVITHLEDTPAWEAGSRLLAEIAEAGRPNAYRWNGTIGDDQRAWLADQLRDAERHGLQAVVLAHHPIYPEHSGNLLDDLELRDWLLQFPALRAWLNGHQHHGAYGQYGHLHCLTVHGMVQTDQNAYAVARFFADRIEITGYHREPDRTLRLG